MVREMGEVCFAVYTPEGDSVALSTGIIVHVHTMSEAIKYMVRNEYEANPGIRDGDIFVNNDPIVSNVHNADIQTFVPVFWDGELIAWVAGVTHEYDYGAIFQSLNAFATVDLSAVYVDISKDRLYTFAARSRDAHASSAGAGASRPVGRL